MSTVIFRYPPIGKRKVSGYSRASCTRLRTEALDAVLGDTAAIVVDRETDRVNELEAHRFGAGYVSAQDAPAVLAELVEAALHEPRGNALARRAV